MKRYASLDFLRGLAIFLMIVLHQINHVLDKNTLFANINDFPAINILMLIFVPFLGGLAGFFLLVSAIGNMISMYKYLEKGQSVSSLVLRQIVQGFLLLFFACVTEGFTGYLGTIGNMLRSINPNDLSGSFLNPTDWQMALWRWNHFETIHTIAWCVIINGIVQGIISRKGLWKDHRRLIRNYIILAIAVFVLTQFVWMFVDWLIPNYPFIKDPKTGLDIIYPLIGVSSFWEIIRAPILAALASSIEPIFPYLAISFLGSIIGIMLCLPKEKIPKKLLPGLFITAIIMGIVGVLGVAYTVVMWMDAYGFDAAIELYLKIPFHREWVPQNPEFPGISMFAWIWQFFAVNGFGFLGTMVILYLIDFRGKGEPFARKTSFIRRLGFVAFTNYNNQWYYWLTWFFFSLALGKTPYAKFNWGLTWIQIGITLLVFWIVNILWEKIGYIGSIEWAIGTIGSYLRPGKKEEKQGLHWWQRGKLNVKEGFYNAEWQTMVIPDEQYHKDLRDSKIALQMSWLCLFCLFFLIPIPFSVAIDARKLEGKNKYNTRALIVSGIGTVLVVGIITLLCIFTPNQLGFAL